MVKAILCGQANVGAEFSAEGRRECPCLLPVTDKKQQMETAFEGAGLVVSEQISKEPQEQRPSLTLRVVRRLLQQGTFVLSCTPAPFPFLPSSTHSLEQRCTHRGQAAPKLFASH